MSMRMYEALLGLYPREHRERFGPEMRRVFEQAAQERHSGGRRAYATFAAAELLGLVRGAACEWFAVSRRAGKRSATALLCIVGSLIAGSVVAASAQQFLYRYLVPIGHRDTATKATRDDLGLILVATVPLVSCMAFFFIIAWARQSRMRR